MKNAKQAIALASAAPLSLSMLAALRVSSAPSSPLLPLTRMSST